MGLLDNLSNAEMQQLAGLFANMPTFSGRRNPMQPMANYWGQAGEREKAEKRQKELDEMNKRRFGMDMHNQYNAINQQAIQNQRQQQADQRKGEMYQSQQNYANSFNPQSSLYSTPGLFAGQEPSSADVQAFRMQQGLKAGIMPPQSQDPSSVREFQYAKSQGYKGAYQDFLNIKKQNTNVNVNVNDGKQPLTSSTTTQTQKDLSSLNESISRFDNLKGMYSPDYLTNQGKIKGSLLKFFDKWGVSPDTFPGDDNNKFLAGITTHKQAVEQEFNQYRKEITGAAAALAELDRLMKTFINTDLSPTQYKASFNQIYQKMVKARDIKEQLLKEGISVNSKEFTTLHNKLYLDGKGKNQPLHTGLSGDVFSGISDDEFLKMRPR